MACLARRLPNMRLQGAFAACAMALLAFGPAQAADAAIAATRIAPNLFLLDSPKLKSTYFNMVVRAGCADESGSQCLGISHYLEHIILVGRNASDKDNAVQMFGDGFANGRTNQTHTIYEHRAPLRDGSSQADLEKLFGFYAARLAGFEISDADAERERNVVLQEYNLRIARDPYHPFRAKMDKALLPHSPLGQDVVGSPESIAAYRVADARAFHQRWYVRDNVSFVVGGHIAPAALAALADRALAPIAARPLEDRAWVADLQRFENAEILLRDSASAVHDTLVTVAKLIHMPENDPRAERAAMSVLNAWLGGRLAGSPEDALVEHAAVAQEIGTVGLYRNAPKVWLLVARALPADEAAPEKLAGALNRYIDELGARSFDAAVLERLKARLIADRALADNDPEVAMNRLVFWLAAGNSFEDYQAWTESVSKLDVAQMDRVVAAVAAPGRRVTGILQPTAK